MHCSFVLIETFRNQDYIFGTNRLRDNVGASQLTYEAGTEWVVDAIRDHVAIPPGAGIADLLSSTAPRIDDKAVEVVVATSGKALLLVKDPMIGEAIIQAVTLTALRKAAGMEIAGVVGKPFDWTVAGEAAPAQNNVYAEIEQVRSRRARPSSRFPRNPLVADCAMTGLPATGRRKVGDSMMSLSQPCLDKLDAFPRFAARITRMMAARFGHEDDWRTAFQSTLDDFEMTTGDDVIATQSPARSRRDAGGWIAIAHADVNGLGDVMKELPRHLTAEQRADNRGYVDALRRFSAHLDERAIHAFRGTLDQFWEGKSLGVLPLVLGGDDMTVVCLAPKAIDFVKMYLTGFETFPDAPAEYLLDRDFAQEIAMNAFHAPRFGICAGIAFIKPHHPFHAAYDLSAQLTGAAKMVKETMRTPADNPAPCSAVSFHAVYDSSHGSLAQILEQRSGQDDREFLSAQPYVVTDPGVLSLRQRSREWLAPRHFSDLETAVAAIRKKSDGQSTIPNSVLHELRASVFDGRAASDASLTIVRSRHKPAMRDLLNGDGNSLFRNDGAQWVTGLLDAMDAAAMMGQ